MNVASAWQFVLMVVVANFYLWGAVWFYRHRNK